MLELVSAFTSFSGTAHSAALVIAAFIMMFFAYRYPSIAASALLVEYVIGSKGALLRFGGDGMGHGGIPLRIALFVAFVVGWLFWSIQHKTYRDWPLYVRGRGVYVCLAIMLGYAFLRGMYLNNTFVFEDANAWGVWMLLLPALDLTHHLAPHLRRDIPRAVGAAFVMMTLKTLVLFYLFAHLTDGFWLNVIYLWVRRTGVGELTHVLVGSSAWRVFFQSHIYVLPVILGGLWYALSAQNMKRRGWIFSVLAAATLIVSLSRSLVIGVVGGGIASLGYGFGMKRVEGVSGLKYLVGTTSAALLLVGMLFYAPPHSIGSLTNLFASRTDMSGEAAVSRWVLLPALWKGITHHPVLGSGFGAIVTYQSHDPRLVATANGAYTTYAFEWGWLDHWFKLGIFGIPLMMWIVIRLAARSWRTPLPLWIRGTLVTSLFALATTHVFTPYLNHPLGIVWLVSVEAWLSMKYA